MIHTSEITEALERCALWADEADRARLVEAYEAGDEAEFGRVMMGLVGQQLGEMGSETVCQQIIARKHAGRHHA